MRKICCRVLDAAAAGHRRYCCRSRTVLSVVVVAVGTNVVAVARG